MLVFSGRVGIVLAVVGLVGGLLPGGAEATTETILYSFTAGATTPTKIINVNGVFYGAAAAGGNYGRGAIFSITPEGSFKILYSFKGPPDGESPAAGLTYADGVFYGATSAGGALYEPEGTVFSLTPGGAEKVIYSFSGGNGNPNGSLVYMDGVLYGTTRDGSLVFSLTPAGVYTTLHQFGGKGDGESPVAGLINVEGTLYGTTTAGGVSCKGVGCGTVYSITPAGIETVIYRFKGALGGKHSPCDGHFPAGSLTYVNGILYGTTIGDGGRCLPRHSGSSIDLFGVELSGVEAVLVPFGMEDDPHDLVQVDNKLYGASVSGGPNHLGTLYDYKLGASGGIRTVHSFGSGTDGIYPEDAPVKYHGALYGTTGAGGAYNLGTVYKIVP